MSTTRNTRCATCRQPRVYYCSPACQRRAAPTGLLARALSAAGRAIGGGR